MADRLMEYRKSVEVIKAALSLRRQPVGVKLVRTKEEYECLLAPEPKHALNYCQMVMSGSAGHVMKACDRNFRCRSGARVLGIDLSDDLNANGENWCRLGLYETGEISAAVRSSLSYVKEDVYGILIGAADRLESVPDVVIVAAEPFSCMRLIQGYAYRHGMPENIRMIGNQAFCLECTARPFVQKDINVSLLCTGTRHRTGWKDYEMAVGIPIEQFADVADGVLETVNIMESDVNKERIDGNLREKGIEYAIKYHDNYYDHCNVK